MSESKWTEQSACATVTRNGGKIKGRVISTKKAGLKVLSAIDFLVNHKDYFWSGTESADL